MGNDFFSHSSAAETPGGGAGDAEHGTDRPSPGGHKTMKECARNNPLWEAVFTGHSATTGVTSVK